MDFTGAAGDMNVIAMPSEKTPPGGVIPRVVWGKRTMSQSWGITCYRRNCCGAERNIYLEEQFSFQFSREVVKSSLSIHPSEEENRSKVPLGVYPLRSNANNLAGTKNGIAF